MKIFVAGLIVLSFLFLFCFVMLESERNNQQDKEIKALKQIIVGQNVDGVTTAKWKDLEFGLYVLQLKDGWHTAIVTAEGQENKFIVVSDVPAEVLENWDIETGKRLPL